MDFDRLTSGSVTSLVSVTFVGRLLGRGFTYGMLVYISQILGADALGTFTVGLLVLKFGGAVTQVGMSTTAQKFVPVYRNDEDSSRLTGVVLVCLGVPFVVGLVLSGVLYSLRGTLVPLVGSEILSSAAILVFGIPLFGVFSVGESATLGFKETKYAVYIRDFAQAGSAFLFVVIASTLSTSIFAVSLAYLASFVVAATAVIVFLTRLGAFDGLASPSVNASKVLRYSASVMPKSLSGPLIRWVDILVLTVLATATQIGWYQASYQTAMLLIFALVSVNSVFPPLASDLYDRGDHETLHRLYTSVTKWAAVFTLYATLFVIVFRRDVLILFGDSFINAEWVLVVLALGKSVDAIIGPSGFFLSMTGNERLEMINSLTAAVLNLILNVLLFLEYGLIGAAIATSVSVSLLNLGRLAEIRYLSGFVPYSRGQLINIVPLGLAVSPMLVVVWVLPTSPIRLIVGGVLSLPVFLVALLRLSITEEDELLRRSITDI